MLNSKTGPGSGWESTKLPFIVLSRSKLIPANSSDGFAGPDEFAIMSVAVTSSLSSTLCAMLSNFGAHASVSFRGVIAEMSHFDGQARAA